MQNPLVEYDLQELRWGPRCVGEIYVIVIFWDPFERLIRVFTFFAFQNLADILFLCKMVSQILDLVEIRVA